MLLNLILVSSCVQVLVRNALFQVVLGFYILKTLNFHAVKAGFILIYLFIFQCSAKIF